MVTHRQTRNTRKTATTVANQDIFGLNAEIKEEATNRNVTTVICMDIWKKHAETRRNLVDL